MRVHEGQQNNEKHFIGPVTNDDPIRRNSRIFRKPLFNPVRHEIRIQVPGACPAEFGDFLFYRGRPVAGIFVLVELDPCLAGLQMILVKVADTLIDKGKYLI
jgi:hypothetical protein